MLARLAALAALAGLVFLRWVLDPWLGPHLPLALLFGAVALAAWSGGVRFAALLTIAGYLVCDLLFIDPRGELGVVTVAHAIGLLTYLVSCAIIIGFAQAARHSLRRGRSLLDQARRAGADRDSAERSLRVRDEHLRLITDSIPALISYVDTERRYRFVNREYERWFGRPREAFLGRSMEQVLGPAAMEVLRPHVEAALRGASEHFEIESPYRDGGARWIDAQYVPDRGPDGSVRGFFVLVLDVTERKRAEQALQQSEQRLRQQQAELAELNRTLEQRVIERSTRLRTMAAELTQIEQRERVRLAQVLHDHLQQLLVSAKLKVSSALDGSPGPHSQRALEEARGLLDDSIHASRSLAVELSPPVLQQQGLGAALGWLVRWIGEKHGLAVELSVEPASEPGNSDVRLLLFQAVRELLLNVVKHADVGRAHVTLRRTGEDQVEVRIRDEGQGFERGSPTECAARGYGLFSVEHRLEAIGGTIRIDSARGRGTTVTLLVPAGGEDAAAQAGEEAPSSREAPHEAPGAASVRGPALRVLIADDHRFFRSGLIELLQSAEGIEVVGEAADGQQALDLARELAPDVVVMDVGMPRLDGIEATRQLKQALPQARVIALSMHDDESVAQAMRRAGADAYLTKDAGVDRLVATIRSVAVEPVRAASPAASDAPEA